MLDKFSRRFIEKYKEIIILVKNIDMPKKIDLDISKSCQKMEKFNKQLPNQFSKLSKKMELNCTKLNNKLLNIEKKFSEIKTGGKKVRKHKGIIQTGGNAGKLRKGYKYSGKRFKNGKSEIVKVKSKKKIVQKGGFCGGSCNCPQPCPYPCPCPKPCPPPFPEPFLN